MTDYRDNGGKLPAGPGYVKNTTGRVEDILGHNATYVRTSIPQHVWPKFPEIISLPECQPPRKGAGMKHQHPQDENIARQLAKLGKTRDCICYIEYEGISGMRTYVSLDYDLSCSVHFPITSSLTVRKRRTIPVWPPEPVSADSVVSEMTRAERLNTD